MTAFIYIKGNFKTKISLLVSLHITKSTKQTKFSQLYPYIFRLCVYTERCTFLRIRIFMQEENLRGTHVCYCCNTSPGKKINYNCAFSSCYWGVLGVWIYILQETGKQLIIYYVFFSNLHFS